jgi:hypothetical protein
MSSKLFIPPPDVRTRIIGTHVRRALYSHTRDHNALNHVDISVAYDDQYWYIKPGKGEHEGLHLIVSAYTKRCLFVNFRNGAMGKWGDVGTSEPEGHYQDQYFDLAKRQGQGTQAGQFRIHAPSGGGVLFSRLSLQPELGCISITDNVYPDHWFTFEMEHMDMIDIHFDVKNAVIESTRPRSIFGQESENTTAVVQTPLIEINKTTEQQSTFESEFGMEIGVSATFSTGVPLVAEAEVEISTKVHTNLKWGITSTESQTWKTSVPLTVPPGETYKVTATVNENVLKVPFQTTWKSPYTGKTIVTQGIFRGISSSDLKTSFFSVTNSKNL